MGSTLRREQGGGAVTIKAKIILDSVNPRGVRLTTWELTYPRMVHAELMTHRVFSRNSASSRAIPTAKLIQRVIDDPAMPVWWGKNQAGMQSREELSDAEDLLYPGGPIPDPSPRSQAKTVWLQARDAAVEFARKLNEIGLHKQIANRVIEPWMHITVIMSTTKHRNWFALRDHPDAQPEIAALARAMRIEHEKSEPRKLYAGTWHLPLLEGLERWVTKDHGIEDLKLISASRCARVSLLTHDGKRDPAEDVALGRKLLEHRPPHLSPFEHVAMALDSEEPCGNFHGWRQMRKDIPGESGE